MLQYKAIVVDDEPSARRIIKFLCSEYEKHIEIVGEAENGVDAISLINNLKPDLVFLDIQMPDLTGFQVLEKIAHPLNVIFITAYEQYAINAFETFAVDYLLKPVKDERFIASIKKLDQFGKINTQPNYTELSRLIDQLKPKIQPTTFPVKIGDKIILLEFDEISHFEASDKYVNIATVNGSKYLTEYTLTALEDKLPNEFLRVKKSFIINRKKIKEIHKHFNGRYVLSLQNKENFTIVTGSTYAQQIKEALGLNF